MASLGRVAAGIAHEIRNPLSGINIYLDALGKMHERSEAPERMPHILEHMKAASARIEAVIKRVMDFARPTQPRMAPADVNECVRDALGLCGAALRKNGIETEFRLAPDIPVCRMDSNLIAQVILNLVTNAADAMKQTGREKRLAVSSSFSGGRIAVKVADSGPGVPPENRRRIFDPFYTTKDDGTGIGLSLSRRIVADHGGEFDVFESEWGGAEFVFELPVDGRV
jgi:signal transduction histidine kinase